MLLIGSHAAKIWYNDWKSKFLDYDFIAYPNEIEPLVESLRESEEGVQEYYPTNGGKTIVIKSGKAIYDIEVAWEGSSGEAILNQFSNIYRAIACPYDLYLLKMSHRYKKNSPHFLKTMRDVRSFRDRMGLPDTEPKNPPDWYALRCKETYNYNHPKLNTTSKEFFRPEDTFYKYDHDWIHEVIAVGHRPAYLEYQVDGEEVLCSKEKFYIQPYNTRLNGVYEEACVLALERSQIPFRGTVDPRKSFTMALEKVCTSITSGWFREFAWENYEQAMLMAVRDKFQYADRFFRVADTGNVKLFTGSKY
jgi:hypothetical protein